MSKNDDFYVGYIDHVAPKTKGFLKRFVAITLFLIVAVAVIFSLTQSTFKNSTFELTSTTQITGIYHENPYPMLRVPINHNSYKNIVLLGFGKSSVNPYLQKVMNEVVTLDKKEITVEGNLIYYNGKTLLQITSQEKVSLTHSLKNISSNIPISKLGQKTLDGEIIDPKCYFGVMKPGKGKIHRSCAVRCISGGIPPVFATKDQYNNSQYYLITDQNGMPINKDILPYIGKPSIIKGYVEEQEDWSIIKINTNDINIVSSTSDIYQ